MKRYKVTCLKCKESDVLTIDERQHYVSDYEGKLKTPFRAFRWRPDMRWGIECSCGQDDRLAPQEANDVDKLVDGDPISIERIVQGLKDPSPRFKMEAV